MKVSHFFLTTLKETPADAELVSHRLMLRSGMIRKLASGIYTWLPLGLRVLRKVEMIVREEMNKSGALELLMPVVQPAELWQETDRWEKFGDDLLKIKDRHGNDFCVGPTHEEIITDLARRELRSYKQLPLNLYQIQTKFRDEIRPRFGVMRAREFMMKDAYSFDMDEKGMQESYQKMYDAYVKIITRLGLEFRVVLADSGTMGGNYSHEFQVLAQSGEDTIAYSDASSYAANIERAEAQVPQGPRPKPTAEKEKIATPGIRTIKELATQKNIPPEKSVKTLIVKGNAEPFLALIIRGDHELNAIKVEHLEAVVAPLTLATDQEIQAALGCSPGSLGPVNLSIPYIVDRDAAHVADFTCGANEEGYHYINVNWERDVALGKIADLRNVIAGDRSPDGKGKLCFTRGIEVGHIFQQGTRYSNAMKACVLDQLGKSIPLQTGAYGLGVSRMVAAAIEQHHDEHGIIWPKAMAPFDIALVPVQMYKSYRVREAVETLYETLCHAGYETLLDDRKERPGVMFADMDLIGIPYRLVVSEKGLDQGIVEYKARYSAAVNYLPLEGIVGELQKNSLF